MNAESRRVAHMDRRTVARSEATGGLHGAYDLVRSSRPDTDDKRTGKAGSGFARAVGNEHPYVETQLHVSYANASLHEGVFKGKTAAQKKTHQIILPTGHEIINLVDQVPMAVHTVARDV